MSFWILVIWIPLSAHTATTEYVGAFQDMSTCFFEMGMLSKTTPDFYTCVEVK